MKVLVFSPQGDGVGLLVFVDGHICLGQGVGGLVGDGFAFRGRVLAFLAVLVHAAHLHEQGVGDAEFAGLEGRLGGD